MTPCNRDNEIQWGSRPTRKLIGLGFPAIAPEVPPVSILAGPRGAFAALLPVRDSSVPTAKENQDGEDRSCCF